MKCRINYLVSLVVSVAAECLVQTFMLFMLAAFNAILSCDKSKYDSVVWFSGNEAFVC